MSNTTRQGDYDESLVVPQEASRRGAHRARANRLLAALPLLAVVVVVAGVIAVAYALFLKPSATDTSSQGLPTVPAPSAAPSVPAASASGGASSSPPSASASPSVSASATVDKSVSFKVYNGSVNRVTGLAARARDALKAAGWSGGRVEMASPPVPRSQTTKIYFAKSSQRATAEALASALKVGTATRNTAAASGGIVLVVGDDYNR